MTESPTATQGLCPICRAPAQDDCLACPHCGGSHHRECWDYNGGCGKYGCPSAPAAEKLTDIEIPSSFWGQTEKECPACHQRIQAAALRCRFCGAVYASTTPQATAEFTEHQRLQQALPKLRRQITWLLVLSILPFTAPLAAVGGPIWYVLSRRRLRAASPRNRAVAIIALVVALFQTIFLIAATLLKSWLPG